MLLFLFQQGYPPIAPRLSQYAKCPSPLSPSKRTQHSCFLKDSSCPNSLIPSCPPSSSNLMSHSLAFNNFPLFHVSSLLPQINCQLLKSKSHIITSSVFPNGPRQGWPFMNMHWLIHFISHSEIPSSKSLLSNYKIGYNWAQYWTEMYYNSILHKHWERKTLFPRMSSDNHIQRNGKRYMFSDTCYLVKLMLSWEFTCE